MAKCVNITDKEFIELQKKTGINPIELAAQINIWQEKNNTDEYPPDNYFDGYISKTSSGVEDAKQELNKTKLEIPKIASDNRTFERLKKLYKSQIEALKTRKKHFEEATSRKGYIPKEDTINRITDLLDKIIELEEREGYLELIEYAKNELSTIATFLDGSLDGKIPSKFNITNQDHINALLEIQNQLKTYQELSTSLPDFVEDDSLTQDIRLVNKLFKNTQDSVNEKLEEYLKHFIKNNTKRNLTDDEIKKLLTEAKDISFQESKFGGMSNSMDTLLQLLHKYVEEGREEIYEKTNSKNVELTNWKKRLKDAGIEGFNWMLQLDSAGKKTGKVLNKISNAYDKFRSEQFSKLRDEFNNKLEYIVKDKLSLEERRHNVDLAKRKAKLAEFLSPEYIDQNTGEVTTGEHHRYTDEFLRARNFYEIYDPYDYKYTKAAYNENMTKADGSKLTQEEFDKNYTLYRRKYYTEPTERYVAVRDFENQQYTGEVKLKRVSFVKPEFIEPLDKWNDENYSKLMDSKTTEGKLKQEFYEFYKKEFGDILKNLPKDVHTNMSNKILRIKSNFANSISKNGKGFFDAVSKSVRNFINPEIITSGRALDENGNPVNDVGYYYVGDLKNQKVINNLNNKLEKLNKELFTNPQDKTIINKIKSIKNKLLIEENKLTPDELEYDLIESLSKGYAMSENYSIMKKIESTLLIAHQFIAKRKYYKNTDAQGNQVGKEFKNTTSNTQERLESYLRTIFYGNSDANNNKISKLVQNFNKYTSIKSLGLNPFSAINNGIMANINTRIEAFGNQFGWNNKHLNESTNILNQYLLGGTYIGHFMDKWKDGGKFAAPSNKFEAMLKHFNWLEQLDDRHSKGLSGGINDLMYIGITAGEFTAQSRSAIAKLLATEIKNAKGESINLWEAYDFKNGKLELKPGFEFSLENKRKLSVEIKNMNKIIHGNYSETDKAAIQEYALGQMALQFKKWMYNFGKNRFGNTYFDETSGTQEEGRYRTLVNLFKHLKETGFSDFKASYNSLSSEQQANMRKNAAEFTYFITSLALYILFDALSEGIDDDDEELKRVVNFLAKQSDRVRGEIVVLISPTDVYNAVKNPVAGVKTIKDFMEFTGEVLKTPYYMVNTDAAYYTKGSNKGQLKVLKQGRDLIPVLQLKGQYDQLLNSNNFFFR